MGGAGFDEIFEIRCARRLSAVVYLDNYMFESYRDVLGLKYH